MREIRTGCNDSCPYYMSNTGCFKPEGLYCPPMSITINNYETSYKELKSTIAKRCAICGNNIEFIKNSDEIICSECKEAIKKLKEWLEEERHD